MGWGVSQRKTLVVTIESGAGRPHILKPGTTGRGSWSASEPGVIDESKHSRVEDLRSPYRVGGEEGVP